MARLYVKGECMNTRISYLYRDADNYKNMNEVVIPGSISDDQIKIILDCLYDGEFFIPEQVGLPEERFGSWTEADHCWFEMAKYSFELTDSAPNWNMAPDKLVEMFLKAKNNWHETEE